ncbi:MAG: hypothetical protein N2561_04355 [Bacteroidetes bacterium]|nr:hypothetical protein [Rhodothermia bacterium]MCS7154212.1 hypothetical protein [Bacteroidota bacterium]MCX7906752.1 hypothetical protein [Bacteroidota bacterium]MDW8136968.1 hypothetical protein [Bacteroidota bacterium]MDW8285161.1 hypothetical protein [Bacteroidota bacterium]
MAWTKALALARWQERFTAQWIVSPRADLLWFIGGALAGYGLLYLHAGLHLDMITVWFLWVLLLDSPHFFGTYSRTYFDKEEWQRRKALLLGSLLWFLVGPAVLGLSYVGYRLGWEGYRIPFLAFLVFFNLWAYWHVVRQHYGILSLYRRKNGETGLTDLRIDQALLYGGLLAPFVAFAIRHPQARAALGLPERFPEYPALSGSGLEGRLSALWELDYWRALHWEHFVVAVAWAAWLTVIAAFLLRQLQRWRAGLPLNGPKLLFLLALIPLYSYIGFSSVALTAPLLAFSAFVTIYHDIQYHAIVWFHHRNRYHRPGVDPKRFGLAAKISRSFLTYMACGIAMAAVFRLLGCALEVHPGCGPLVLTSQHALFGAFSTRELVLAFLIGFPMHHYFLDQYIWRPSRDETLRRDLKLET